MTEVSCRWRCFESLWCLSNAQGQPGARSPLHGHDRLRHGRRSHHLALSHTYRACQVQSAGTYRNTQWHYCSPNRTEQYRLGIPSPGHSGLLARSTRNLHSRDRWWRSVVRWLRRHEDCFQEGERVHQRGPTNMAAHGSRIYCRCIVQLCVLPGRHHQVAHADGGRGQVDWRSLNIWRSWKSAVEGSWHQGHVPWLRHYRGSIDTQFCVHFHGIRRVEEALAREAD